MDIEVINTELALADLQTVDKQMARYAKVAKTGQGPEAKEARRLVDALEKILPALNDARPVRSVDLYPAEQVRAWTVTRGATAPQAAGVIHTDFEKGFIRAETIAYADYVAHGGEAGAKEAGKMRLEGKDYAVPGRRRDALPVQRVARRDKTRLSMGATMRTSRRRTARAFLLAATLGGAVAPALASEAGLLAPEAALRDQLLRARDDGQLSAPSMMWPVTVPTLRAAGAEVAACEARIAVEAEANEGERIVLGFGDGAPVEQRLGAATCVAPGGSVVVGLRVNADKSSEHRSVHLDGSYAGFVWRGALVSAGAVERFWGPAWAGSLILGDNARPVPAISVRRADPTRPFETRWLSWLGPWDAEVFFGQLQGHTEPRAPRLFGMRVEVSPASWFALGASRTIQWGGAGRSNSPRSLWHAFKGGDNVGQAGVTQANEPGNQLAGFDARASLGRFGVPVALYTQWIGEDEAGYMPSKYMALSGVEAWFESNRWRWRAVLEHVDTVVGVHDEFPGTAYRHHIFRQGYTQRGRTLGFSLGGDVSAAVAQLHAFGDGPWSGSVQALAGRANPGAIAALPYAANSIVQGAALRVRYAASEDLAVEARYGRSRYTPWGGSETREHAGGLSIELRLP